MESNQTMEQKVKKEIRFDLTAEEKVKMADRAGKLSKDRYRVNDTLKAFSKDNKKIIKEYQKEIDQLLENHVKGFEMREVEATERLDWDLKTVTTFFNNEEIESRTMHDSELQMKLKTGPDSTVKNKPKTKLKKAKKTKVEKNPEKNLTPEELEENK